MTTRTAKAVLSWMKLKYEAGGVVVNNDSQGLIMIDHLSQLNEESVEGLLHNIQSPVGTTAGVYNPGVSVSSMAEANIQVMIYYIKHFKTIDRTCSHAGFDLSKVFSLYHQQYMEEAHRDPEVVPMVDPKDWPKILEMVEEYIRGFQGVDGKPHSYGLREYLIAPVAESDTTYRANGIEYFTP